DRFPRDTAALHRDGINGWRRARRESLTEPSTPAVACPVWAAFVAMSIVAPSSLTLAGVGLALMASCISPVGISLQKLSHSRHAAGRADTAVAADLLQRSAHSTRYYRQGLWLVGMGLVAAASLLDFLALGIAPQIIVAPTGTLALVFNIFCARFILGEPITSIEIISTVVTFAGTIIAVIAARTTNVERTVSELLRLYLTYNFFGYAFTILLGIGILARVSVVQRRLRKQSSAKYNARTLRFSLSALSGIIGSCNVLFAKCLASLLFACIEERSASMFATLWPYCIAAGLCTSVFFQFKVLNSALKLFNAAHVVPVFQLCWLLGSVISGMVFFQEYAFFTTARLMVFLLGLAITIGGVVLLSISRTGQTSVGHPASAA
ncbi:hypothetical protein PBRA_004472, partial [Plasmodiophora brassicae]